MNAIVPTTDRTTPILTRRSLDQLEEDIISLSQHINATEYEFLVLLREFDLRQGWKAYHFNNCAEWLNMKCGMCPRTAREKLRVANAYYMLRQSDKANKLYRDYFNKYKNPPKAESSLKFYQNAAYQYGVMLENQNDFSAAAVRPRSAWRS